MFSAGQEITFNPQSSCQDPDNSLCRLIATQCVHEDQLEECESVATQFYYMFNDFVMDVCINDPTVSPVCPMPADQIPATYTTAESLPGEMTANVSSTDYLGNKDPYQLCLDTPEAAMQVITQFLQAQRLTIPGCEAESAPTTTPATTTPPSTTSPTTTTTTTTTVSEPQAADSESKGHSPFGITVGFGYFASAGRVSDLTLPDIGGDDWTHAGGVDPNTQIAGGWGLDVGFMWNFWTSGSHAIGLTVGFDYFHMRTDRMPSSMFGGLHGSEIKTEDVLFFGGDLGIRYSWLHSSGFYLSGNAGFFVGYTSTLGMDNDVDGVHVGDYGWMDYGYASGGIKLGAGLGYNAGPVALGVDACYLHDFGYQTIPYTDPDFGASSRRANPMENSGLIQLLFMVPIGSSSSSDAEESEETEDAQNVEPVEGVQ